MAFGSFKPGTADSVAGQIINAAAAAGYTVPNIGNDYDKALLAIANAFPWLAGPGSGLFGGNQSPVGISVCQVMAASFASNASASGATPTLVQQIFPAQTFATTATSTLSTGALYAAWGTFANNANAKTVTFGLGSGPLGTALATVTATISQANSWFFLGFMGVVDFSNQQCFAFGVQGPNTPTFNMGSANTTQSLQNSQFIMGLSGTQTSAGDITTNGYVVLSL